MTRRKVVNPPKRSYTVRVQRSVGVWPSIAFHRIDPHILLLGDEDQAGGGGRTGAFADADCTIGRLATIKENACACPDATTTQRVPDQG